MPAITALLHTSNDAQRLGRALETLFPCSDVLIVDHQSTDATVRVARLYGARVLLSSVYPAPSDYLEQASHDWILCLHPSESLTESLQASLFEWSILSEAAFAAGTSFSVSIREQKGNSWSGIEQADTRLIHRSWAKWNQHLPASDPSSIPLEGALLRLFYP